MPTSVPDTAPTAGGSAATSPSKRPPPEARRYKKNKAGKGDTPTPKKASVEQKEAADELEPLTEEAAELDAFVLAKLKEGTPKSGKKRPADDDSGSDEEGASEEDGEGASGLLLHPEKKKAKTDKTDDDSFQMGEITINDSDDLIVLPKGKVSRVTLEKLHGSTPLSKWRAGGTGRGGHTHGMLPDELKGTEEGFQKVLNKRGCGCGNRGTCTDMLRRYYEDPSAPYPYGRPMLIHRISNPKAGGKGKRNVRRRQLYDRVAQLFDVDNPGERKGIDVGIHHFPRTVVERYCQTPPEERAGDFLDFLLPEELVGNDPHTGQPILGRAFGEADRFQCLGTSSQNRKCRKAKECTCKLYLNLPFVTLEGAAAAMGQKVVFQFVKAPAPDAPKEPQKNSKVKKVDGVLVHVCKSCQFPCPKANFNVSQWGRPSGTGECKACQAKYLEKHMDEKAGVRRVQNDNIQLRQQLKTATKEKNKVTAERDKARQKLEELKKKHDTVRRQAHRLKAKVKRLEARTAKSMLEAEEAKKERRRNYPSVIRDRQTKTRTKAAKNPDGSLTPASRHKGPDGRWAKPKGRKPKGMAVWDADYGVWRPLVAQPEAATGGHAGGREEEEESEEEEEEEQQDAEAVYHQGSHWNRAY
ncbi:hypothetical protein ACHAXT_012028 [Thalassiosira profunda]